MALAVQNDTGTTEDAVSYLSVADFKAYHTIRGNAYSSYIDTQIEQALARATDYLDTKFSWYGYPVNGRSQSTKWPRYDVFDADDFTVTGIPKEVKDATAEYAFRALSGSLAPDPVQSPTGFPIKSKMSKVDVVEESISYDTTKTVAALPDLPIVDERLRKAGLAYGVQNSGDIALG